MKRSLAGDNLVDHLVVPVARLKVNALSRVHAPHPPLPIYYTPLLDSRRALSTRRVLFDLVCQKKAALTRDSNKGFDPLTTAKISKVLVGVPLLTDGNSFPQDLRTRGWGSHFIHVIQFGLLFVFTRLVYI